MEGRFYEQDVNNNGAPALQPAQDLPVMTDLQDLSPCIPGEVLSGLPQDLDDADQMMNRSPNDDTYDS